MACLALSRTAALPIGSQSHSRPLLQLWGAALDSTSAVRNAYFRCGKRISISWSGGVVRKRSLLRCQSTSGAGFSERRPVEGLGETRPEEDESSPSGRIRLQSVVFVGQALAVWFASLRAWLHLKMEVLSEESEWGGSLLQQGGLGLALLSTSIIARERISPVLITLRANPTFMSGLVAWAIAQVLKVFTKYWVERKWDWKMLVGSGGMPSSHSALCVGLTTAVALCHGVADSLFPVVLGFTLIVMYDAAGVRRHAGRQAEVLNMIVQDLFEGHPVSEKKLKELLGHTPLQVGAGAILGIICGFICSRASMIY